LGYRARIALGLVGTILTPVLVVGLTTVAAVKFTQLPDGVALRVYGIDVTKDDVAKQTGVLGLLYGLNAPTDPARLDEFRRNSAQTVALNMVLDRAAVENGISSDDAAAANAVNQLLARGGSAGQQQLESALGTMGATHQDLFQEIKRQQLSQQLFEKVTKDAGAQQPVGDPEAQAYFNAHKDQFFQPEMRHLRNIVVADKADADAVVAQLRGGADFAAVAKQRSLDPTTKDKGGDLGFLASDQLEDDYAKAAFMAPAGSVLDPVQGARGWNVGQVLEVRPGVQLNYPDIAENLRFYLAQQKLGAAWQHWVGEQLARAKVQYADEFRPADPDDIGPTGALGEEVAGQEVPGQEAPGAPPAASTDAPPAGASTAAPTGASPGASTGAPAGGSPGASTGAPAGGSPGAPTGAPAGGSPGAPAGGSPGAVVPAPIPAPGG
jgi:peptidyl-prolyl cis-trans isomerase C